MFKIREFAEIAQVPMSTLRYYDEIGVFKPAAVDPETGYRFYSIDQLLQINRILALKDLGLELAQIVQFLDEEVSGEALQGMLRLRQAKLQQHIQAEQEQLARIEARLKYIDQSEGRSTPIVVLKAVNWYSIIAARTQVIGFEANRRYAEALLARIREREIKPTGPTLFLYHESGDVDFDVEVAVPVDPAQVRALGQGWDERVVVRELPDVSRMACTVYHGSPHAIVEAYQALGIWIQANGYHIAGPCRKLCLRWDGELNDYLTEIQYPVMLEQ
ncbi:MerR family transcriptional regulator [Reticulibacter mediterranei]|uniref:MerR family transcriptional regulator n=1 Tax=Reticulibacter mediterranei TaxID=2778369 RepID=A0A8J3IQV6_9CHLR|nr:MerR family transcriptional regulator [Reticulibacter mediterranei]GHO96943.1 MerR family transcriptional regulator [Reticulibacter mediterranei]